MGGVCLGARCVVGWLWIIGRRTPEFSSVYGPTESDTWQQNQTEKGGRG